MMDVKKYENPPIKEVICEFRFSHTSPWDPTIPGLMFEKLKEKFPIRDTGKDIETELKIDGEQVQPKVRLIERAIFKNQQENIIVQVGTHHLVINHLTPYSSWDKFFVEIDYILNTYIKVAEPTGIGRIELRYINEINITEDSFELKNYFDFYPHINENVVKEINSFIVGVQTSFNNDIQKIQMSSNQKKIQLDTSYFIGKPNSINFDDIPNWLNLAHERNIKAFEGCIKDRLRNEFKEVK